MLQSDFVLSETKITRAKDDSLPKKELAAKEDMCYPANIIDLVFFVKNVIIDPFHLVANLQKMTKPCQL